MQKAILNAEVNPSSVRNTKAIVSTLDGATTLLGDLIAEKRDAGASEEEVELLIEQVVLGAKSMAVCFEQLLKSEKEQENIEIEEYAPIRLLKRSRIDAYNGRNKEAVEALEKAMSVTSTDREIEFYDVPLKWSLDEVDPRILIETANCLLRAAYLTGGMKFSYLEYMRLAGIFMHTAIEKLSTGEEQSNA